MHARDPAEAVEVLNLVLKFFGDGERWIKGRFTDRRGTNKVYATGLFSEKTDKRSCERARDCKYQPAVPNTAACYVLTPIFERSSLSLIHGSPRAVLCDEPRIRSATMGPQRGIAYVDA